MNLTPTEQEKALLGEVWQDQIPSQAPPLDLTRPAPCRGSRPASADQVAKALQEMLGWPAWVRLYAKPSLAVVAASKLARSRGLAGGVLWAAPGTGRPLEPASGHPGLVMLRCDWAPDAASVAQALRLAQARGLMLVLDESCTGVRLGRGGAASVYGIDPQVALYGPPLAGGRDFAALAGLGQAPPQTGQAPTDEALAAAAATLEAMAGADWQERLEAWGRALLLGLNYYAARCGLQEEIAWEGPLTLPRLKGKRLWAFIELAREEGLWLEPLVLLDPEQDPGQVPERLWRRLCRCCQRLKVLPQGEKAPAGWSEAHGAGKCASMEEAWRVLES
ncbi:MAG: aminotransferase class III-fold pyridoxal phosphate-dependent enzyme [Pseudomonadota bacterium]